MNCKMYGRQVVKMLVQNIILPIYYAYYKMRPIQENLVIFADAHHDQIPYSMKRMHQEIKKRDYVIQEFYLDFQNAGYWEVIKEMKFFMKCYAAAKYVFICDNYLPVAACKKRSETIVVQLWHGSGAFKKFGYDTNQDIPRFYKGNVYKNYSVVTVSAKTSIPFFASAMRMDARRIKAYGVSRTDAYYDEKYLQQCTGQFYKQHPEAKNKKIALWAPTFRGNAGNPSANTHTETFRVFQELSEEWYFVVKLHPHDEKKSGQSTTDIPTEELLPVADLLITDYSSILFDYLIFKRPILLFSKDIEDYTKERGFYLDYNELPGRIVTSEEALKQEIQKEQKHFDKEKIEQYFAMYMQMCDGKATERILHHITK